VNGVSTIDNQHGHVTITNNYYVTQPKGAVDVSLIIAACAKQ
jgi:hypothetical protein